MPRGKKKVEDAVKAVEEKAVATEVEVKKATRAAGRKAKDKVEEAAAKVAEKVDAAAAAAEIEAGKAKAKRTRKAAEAKEAVKTAVEAAAKPARKARAAKLEIVIQSVMGGAITPEEITAKVPKGAVSAYVKVEENKIYWVRQRGDLELITTAAYDYASPRLYLYVAVYLCVYTALNSMTCSTLIPNPSQSCPTTFNDTGSSRSSFFSAADVIIPLRTRSTW